jgi:hypothetical protein
MTTTLENRLGKALREAGLGRFPEPDGRAEFLPPLPGPCDAVTFFVRHLIVAADVPEEWAFDQLARSMANRPFTDTYSGLNLFVDAMIERLGNPSQYASILTVAAYRPAYGRGKIEKGGEADPGWAAYRTQVQSYRYRSQGTLATFAIGRGPGDRWDVYLRVDEHTESSSQASREVLIAAKTLVPDRGLLFGSAPLHNPRILRTLLSSGFLPICTEVLLLTRPRG